MILMKTIKPARLKESAFRLEFLNAMRKAGTVIKQQDFEKTTATWKHKPKFESVVSLTGPGPVLLVGTDDEIYGYVSRGTKEHAIWAGIYTGKSSKKVLAFPSRSTPKTRPGVIGSGAGSRGKVDTFRPYVMHPGTKPRKFEEAIRKKREKWFKRQMEMAMKRAAAKSGHGL
jgi:hypothetical protein